MFRGVDYAVNIQYFLSARDAQVVHGLESKMSESSAQAGRRCQHHANAGSATVKIQGQMRPKPPDTGCIGREDLLDIRISREHCCEAIFHHHGHAQIGPRLFQQRERGRGQNRIAQRPLTDDRHPCAGR